jgi:predicted enzyme related to lactoylglutathione lyase
MDGKITHVSLVVKDKASALTFYVEKVGFEKKTDVTAPGGYRFVTVGPKGQDLELALWEVGSATDPEQKVRSEHWAPATAPPIVLRVSDCRKTYEELSSHGVEFPQVPKEHPWGVVATFQDSDGNLFSVSELRAWQPQK